jgi:hypothetical protein
MFRQEGRGDHAAAIMHPTYCIQLTHRCIDDGNASTTFTPCFEILRGVFPFDAIVFSFEGFISADVGPGSENV